MTETDIVKAKKIRHGLMIVAVMMAAAGVIALVYPKTDPLAIRVISAAVCFVAASLWTLPTVGRVSFSRCLEALVVANLLLYVVLHQIDRWCHKAKWEAIFHQVAKLNATSSFDYQGFGSFLGHALRGGDMLWVGVTGIWTLNLLALIYLTQTEKHKEAVAEADCTVVPRCHTEIEEDAPTHGQGANES